MSKNELIKRLKEKATECDKLCTELKKSLRIYFEDNNECTVKYDNGRLKISITNKYYELDYYEAYSMMKFIEKEYGRFDDIIFTNSKITGEYILIR